MLGKCKKERFQVVKKGRFFIYVFWGLFFRSETELGGVFCESRLYPDVKDVDVNKNGTCFWGVLCRL